MKKLGLFFTACTLLASCASPYKMIGTLDYLSVKDIDGKGDYQKIASDLGSKKKELKSSTSYTVQQAVDSMFARVPGAEFMTNVKIYVVKDEFVAVSGDVWGQKQNITPPQTDEKNSLAVRNRP